MNRRLLNILSAVSMTLCIAVIALWFTGHWYVQHLEVCAPWIGAIRASSFSGRFVVLTYRSKSWHTFDAEYGIEKNEHLVPILFSKLRRKESYPPPEIEKYMLFPEWRGAGMQYGTDEYNGIRGFIIDAWLAVPPLAALPVWRAIAWTASRRKLRRAARAGLCPSCAYDLRATPDRCPECGTVPAKPQAPTEDSAAAHGGTPRAATHP